MKRRIRITKGYTILQPRIATSLPGAESSWYAKMHSNEPGIDPYTRAVSDVYQDLFQEGSFIGKGIYEIDNFEKVLRNRFPENRILSHDLLEGCYARSALLDRCTTCMKNILRAYYADMQKTSSLDTGEIGKSDDGYFHRVPGPDRHTKKNPLSTPFPVEDL